jgi:dTDP-4-dehydrorhamnose reductase
MLCRQSYHYEPGVFDARSVPPRPTELAIAVAALAKQGYYSDPTLEELGWWRREDRIFSQLRNHGSVSEHLQKVDCI